jgi:hypothetical protein
VKTPNEKEAGLQMEPARNLYGIFIGDLIWPVRPQLSVSQPKPATGRIVLHILPPLRRKILPQFAKADKLFGRQDLSDRQFVGESKPHHIGLRGLELFQPRLNIFVIDRIGVDGLIKGPIRHSETPLSLVHHRFSLGVHAADLLDLFLRKAKLTHQIRTRGLRLSVIELLRRILRSRTLLSRDK